MPAYVSSGKLHGSLCRLPKQDSKRKQKVDAGFYTLFRAGPSQPVSLHCCPRSGQDPSAFTHSSGQAPQSQLVCTAGGGLGKPVPLVVTFYSAV